MPGGTSELKAALLMALFLVMENVFVAMTEFLRRSEDAK
jgi:hypothetical protein